jgi:hypothetical protein
MKYYNFNLLLLILFFQAGCNKEPISSGLVSKVSFTLKTPTMLIAETRAGTAVEELSIENLWVLQFDGNGDGSLLTKTIYIPSITNINDLEMKLNNGSGQTIFFVANTFDQNLFNETNAPLGTFSIASFNLKSISYSSENSLFTGTTSKNLRMYGRYYGDIPNSGATVTLYRNCAKISFSYTSEEGLDIFNPGKIRVTSVQLKNIPATSSYIADPSNIALTNPSSLIDYAVITGSNTGTGTGEAYSIDNYSGNVTFYMPENISGVNPAVTSQKNKAQLAPLKATYLEVKGEFWNNDIFLKKLSFKLHLGKNITSDYNVNCNTNYNISLVFNGVDISDTRIVVYSVLNTESWDPYNW